ncbi:uncharacterized protein BP01DRAFT_363190 [Aspergillus saccharolyticus JOP 1030-1]|uniref:Uncharacterized protein n=1 Tax=Aspergillus saccharolyticus JOP 1030-1 TaxID=1450539 RepID=A0A318ZUI4_9EURO|nr:hypothetical protein BP01DRAFT_363190 [Aspergillus saccharolyticus JOP 1030-1]PYH48003.1 hypothetical protein BP01DRAFT_363190 [Aspergillus saccharolyticus JOP 1030-1]
MPTSTFWQDFPDFELKPDAAMIDEFKRLAAQRGWKEGSKTWRKRWSAFINLEYDCVIGESLTDLDSWRELCALLDLQGPFPSITKCRQALSTVHVNIVDVINCRRQGTKPKKFSSVSQLAKYTHKTGQFFKRNLAKQDQLLKRCREWQRWNGLDVLGMGSMWRDDV